MLGKNNQKLYDQQHADQHQHWALRKLSLGVASVLVSVSIYAGASTISANADMQTSGATETTALTNGSRLTNGSSASSLGSASSVSLNAQSASSATTNKSAANNASATATSAVASSATNEVASATTSNSAQSQSTTSEKANSSATQQNRSASQLLTALFAATSSSTQGTTADYTPKVTTSLPSDYPSQFNNDTYSEYFVFKEVKDELNDVSYYGAVKQDGSESGTVYIFAQSADGTISGPIKLASGESTSQNGITFNNYGDTYTVHENNRNNNNLYYGYSSDGEKDSANRSQGNNSITGVLPTNGQFPLTINYYDKAGNLVSTKSDPQTVLAGKYIEVSAPEVVNGYVLTKTEGNQSGEVSEYTADKVGQTWTRHFTTGLDADYTLNSDGSFTIKVYKNSQLVRTMTVPVDGTGKYQEINGRYLDTYAFPNPYIAGSTSLTYNYTQVGSIVPVDKDGNKIGDEVPYTNDSDDPSKVESNEPVPSIPGYHISTDQPNTDVDVDNGTVTPSDPTKDTEVVYVKDDTTETETKNVTRTINYVDKTTGKTVADSVTQTVTLTRTKTTNGETGKVTYSNWTIDGSWAEQTSPDLSSKGYDAPVFADGSDASKVAAATVNENSNDTTVTVYYPQHSDTTNETKTVKRTIEYLDKKTGEAIPSRLAQPVEQDVTLTRTVDTNKVTGEVTYGDWTVESGSWDEVVSPDLTNYGYTAPDKESVAAETVDGNTENSDVKVYYDHATTTVTPEDPKDPNTPINPNDPDSPKYTEDQTDVTKDASQTVHYTGAGDKTPSDKVQTQKDAFTRTVTIDKVTGKTISTTPWTGSKTFGTEDTPVVNGYHADKKVAGGLTATPENPNVEDTVTYAENGKIIPVDPNGNKIPDAPTPTYPTDPTDPTKVVPDEPVPDIPGYTPETPTVTPSDPGKDTPVVYNKQDGSLTVKYVDQDSNNAVLETKDLSGKYGDQITYTTTDTIKSLEDKGYVLVSDGFTGKAGSTFSDSNNGKTYLVVLKHGTTTVTPDNPKNPGEPINPNDPNGPKYTEDQTDVTRDATQTITYHYSDGSQPDTQTTTTQKDAFTRTVTIDKVTGKTLSSTPWTGSYTFGTADTPVVQGYHADKKTAGGLTATPDHPDVTDQVVYTPNGKIIPVDPNGNKIPDAPTPTYPTDPTDPTKVVPDEPVPDIPGYTPETPTVTPSDPGKDTQVVYNKQDGSLTVKYVDQDSNNAVLETKDLSGKYGDKITYTTADTIKSLEDKGYVLVSDGYTGKVGSEFDNTNNGKTYLVVLKHGTTTVTPDNPKNPGEPINPNDPNGPKYTEDQTDVTKDASQTVHYTGAGDKTPSDKVQTQKDAFTRTVTIDKVTGKTVSTTPWTGSKTFGTEDTPVVDGYHADKKVAGGLTATPEKPNVEDTVTYAENGKIVPVDPDGNKIPNVPNPTYPTDPTDPTKVTPDEPVPDIPGYTPEVPTVTPSDPGKDTPVVYYASPAAIVNFIDEDYVNAQGEKVPTQIGTSGGLTGKIGETIIYSDYDAKLQSYLDKGYVLDKSEYPTKDVYDNDDKTLQTFNVYLKHGTTTVTPEDPKDPNTPINPNDPNGPKYTEDQTDVTRDAKQTVHYTGAGDKTPSDKVQTQKNAFTRTVTIDKVTGKTISTTPWTGSKTFGTETTPVVDGYHADKKVAGGLTATPENPNVEDTVTYAANGKIIPVDPNGNKIPDAPTPTYPTDPTDPTKVVPDEPVPDIPGYTPETPTVTPENPGKDTNVPYTKNPTTPTEDKSSFKVVYVDQDSNNAVLETKGLSGKYGDQITYTTADTIKSLEDKGYVLVSDGFTGKAGSEFSDSNNGKTYLVVLKHGTTTVTPEDPKDPNTPINPNDPNGPKYTKDQTDVTRDATQTITYHYSDGSQPDTQTTSTEKNAFTRTVTVDKVTGKTISTTPWTGSHTFGKVNTPVIQGYHADKKTAGGLTATPDHPDVTDQVVYTPNGKIIPVDPNGNKIPNVPTPTYPTDPTDPTKVVPDEPVPTIPGYTPETPTVTPEDPGADTPVVYHTPMTPTPEKPTTPTTPGSAVPQAPTSGATPASPTAASTSQAPAKKLPQTGDQSATGLVAAGLATLLGLMGTGLKRRKQER